MDKATILRYVRRNHADQRRGTAEEERVLGARFLANWCVTKYELRRVVA